MHSRRSHSMVPWNDVICLILNMRDYIINLDFTTLRPTLSSLTLIQYSEDLTNRNSIILHHPFLWKTYCLVTQRVFILL
jgi:hypothetical protein